MRVLTTNKAKTVTAICLIGTKAGFDIMTCDAIDINDCMPVIRGVRGGSNESSFLREFILTLNNLRNHPRNPRLLDRLCMPETRFSNIGDGPGSCWDPVQLDNYVFNRIINVSVPTFFQISYNLTILCK